VTRARRMGRPVVMRFEVMSASSVAAAERAAAGYGAQTLVVPRTAYIGTHVTTNLPNVLMEGAYVEQASW
jgi:hypothetical protein